MTCSDIKCRPMKWKKYTLKHGNSQIASGHQRRCKWLWGIPRAIYYQKIFNLLKKKNNSKWNIVQVFSGEGEGRMVNRSNSSLERLEIAYGEGNHERAGDEKVVHLTSEDRLSFMSRWGIVYSLSETEGTLSATASRVKRIRPCPHCAQSEQGISLWCLHVIWSCEAAMNSKCSVEVMRPASDHWELRCLLDSFSLNPHFGKIENQWLEKYFVSFQRKEVPAAPQRVYLVCNVRFW